MYAPLRLRVWLVEPPRGPSGEPLGTPPDADVLDEATFRRRLESGDRPDGLLVDVEALERLDGQRFALDGVLRTVIVTNRPPSDLPPAYADRPTIRVLTRPLSPADVDRALLWLEGVDD